MGGCERGARASAHAAKAAQCRRTIAWHKCRAVRKTTANRLGCGLLERPLQTLPVSLIADAKRHTSRSTSAPGVAARTNPRNTISTMLGPFVLLSEAPKSSHKCGPPTKRQENNRQAKALPCSGHCAWSGLTFDFGSTPVWPLFDGFPSPKYS